MEERELIIIGGGPAGLTAGIYGVRAELNVLVLEAEAPGGQIATAGIVENYPGFPEGIMGIDLAENMRKQAENAGVEIRSYEPVKGIKWEDSEFVVTTEKQAYKAKAVLIATGLKHRKLGIPGEKGFNGKGVSYCFTCDGPLYKNKEVVVVGSGTGAVEASVFLDNIASKVTMVTKSADIRSAEAILKTRLEKSNVNTSLLSKPIEVLGDSTVKGLKVEDLKSGEEKVINADGIFVEIGMKPNTAFLEGSGVKMEKGFVVVDDNMRMNIPGLYAAGDVIAGSSYQLGVAVAQGTLASLDAYRYIKSLG
ncbi:MAG: NAD(P)/FAD-dependent oxidoreductase [Candidatus Hydrothermarchaeaceae archaeon]